MATNARLKGLIHLIQYIQLFGGQLLGVGVWVLLDFLE